MNSLAKQPQATTASPSIDELRTIEQLCNEYPDLISEHALRWVLRHRHENGLAEHVTHFGKSLVVYVPGFVRWLMTRGN